MKKDSQQNRLRSRDGELGMFVIETRPGAACQVVVVGKATRKRAKTFINIPISASLRERLDTQLVGSLAMGTGALLEWALEELKRQGISIEARVRG
ncbi:MAG: hypothetical protein WAN46_16530 [Gammaproteobacteria bacterium]